MIRTYCRKDYAYTVFLEFDITDAGGYPRALPINEFAAQFLAQLEKRHSLGGHLNALSTARIATLAGTAVAQSEATETS